MESRNWYVADYNGNLAGHDLDRDKAMELAEIMQEREPDAEWEAMESEN